MEYSRIDNSINNFLPESIHKHNESPGLNFQISKLKPGGISHVTHLPLINVDQALRPLLEKKRRENLFFIYRFSLYFCIFCYAPLYY